MGVRRGLEMQRVRALRTAALAGGIFMLLMVPWRMSGIPGPGPMPRLALHGGIWGAVLLAYALGLHLARWKGRGAEWMALGLVIIGLGITSTQLFLYGRLQETASTLLISLISGGALQRRSTLAVFQTLLLAVWLALAIHIAGWAAAATWLFDIVLAGVLAFCLQHLLSRVLSALLLRLERQHQTLHDLRQALDQVRTLNGLIPICAQCKKIRNDGGYWEQVESYIQAHSEAEFTHGICPDCAKALRQEVIDLQG